MKKIIFVLCLLICFYSCKSAKNSKKSSENAKTVSSRPSKVKKEAENSIGNKTELPHSVDSINGNFNIEMAQKIIDYAKTFEGVRYKYGGTDKKGMDCSGLVTSVFMNEGISLPRSSSDMALSGDWIDMKEAQKGDLLFFATKRNSRNITHVGLVTYVNEGQIEFIHSTTSAGVITSSLAEKYWYFAFVQARRVL